MPQLLSFLVQLVLTQYIWDRFRPPSHSWEKAGTQEPGFRYFWKIYVKNGEEQQKHNKAPIQSQKRRKIDKPCFLAEELVLLIFQLIKLRLNLLYMYPWLTVTA